MPRPACGCRNSCDQAISVSHAAGAVLPLDPELIQAGEAAGERAPWPCLVHGRLGPVGVAEVLVPTQDGHRVPLVPDQGTVQQLAPAASVPPL